MKKALLLPIILPMILTAACAKGPDASRSWQPPPPCYKNLNTTDCGPEIKDGSTWSSNIQFTNADREITALITVYYEFGRQGDQTAWKRVITVAGAPGKGLRTMFESGYVTTVNEKYLDLTLNSVSCPAEMETLAANPKTMRLYYERRATGLQLSSLPIVNPPPSSDLGWIFVDAVGQVISRAITTTVQGIFTFGSARSWLEKDIDNLEKVDRLNTKELGIVGCFSSLGYGFKPLAMPATDALATEAR